LGASPVGGHIECDGHITLAQCGAALHPSTLLGAGGPPDRQVQIARTLPGNFVPGSFPPQRCGA
jgi:hypothetical protein